MLRAGPASHSLGVRRDPLFIVTGCLCAALAAVFIVLLLSEREPDCGPDVGQATDNIGCGGGLVWRPEAVVDAAGASIFGVLAIAAFVYGVRRRSSDAGV